jgi:hypothetical protein
MCPAGQWPGTWEWYAAGFHLLEPGMHRGRDMAVISFGLCLLVAVGAVPKNESAAVPAPSLTISVNSSIGSEPLDDLVRFPALPPLLAEAGTDAAPAFIPVKPVSAHKKQPIPEATKGQKEAWAALTVLQHGAASFDAWSTRVSVTSGHGKELNPIMKPFASSGAIYGAIQVAPLATDWWARRLQRSNHPTLRRLWWVPQAAAAVGFTFSGVNNLKVASGK